MPTAREKRDRYVSGLIRFAATPLAVAGWLAMTLPSTAQGVNYLDDDFRTCAARLLSVGVSNNEAASACAAALNPGNLSRCVAEIELRTEIAAADALATCRQVRRPEELAGCVVDISRNSEKNAVPGVLDYCGRSLLPERFAECVVGLNRVIEVAPTRAMETCIDARDPLADIAPGFVPPNQTPLIRPAPPAPAVPQDTTPLVEPNPAPTAPANPGGQ
jgi:hypothetical protein